MKRSILIIFTFFFFVALLASCKSHERCPAYGKSVEKQEDKERA
ncbi:MAG: hypothetical protein ABEH38_06545 [Flavobacteriales bacterium]